MVLVALSLALSFAADDSPNMLPVGKKITPLGTHTSVGSYPSNMIFSPDRKSIVVSTVGFREYLSLIDVGSGKVTQLPFPNDGPAKVAEGGLYYGLSFGPGETLYVSHGASDMIGQYQISADRRLLRKADALTNKPLKGSYMPNHPAGLAVTPDGTQLLVANNQTTHTTDYKGSLSFLNLESGKEVAKVSTSAFPFAVTIWKDRKVYVAGERDNIVDVVDIQNRRALRQIRVGANPEGLALSPNLSRLYVSNYGSDTLTVVDTSTDKVLATIMLRPVAMSGLPGAGPTGLTVSPNGKWVYVALQDMMAVAVVNAWSNKLEGYLPVGWLPTSVLATSDTLFVANAKGVKAANPNGKPVNDWGTYIQDVIDGCVSKIDLSVIGDLDKHTAQVITNNRLRKGLESPKHPDFKNPGIKHVIYIVKENRTYDNVLGDIARGNGDASLCLFPQKVTPNQHALAERFALLDNFHVCAEVSQDGWVWSTAGMVNAYASRNTPYNYSGRGRNYDTEGSNNGIPVDLIDIPDVTRPPSGYIWEQCQKHGVSFRNYGFFTQFNDPLDKRYDVFKERIENGPTKKLLKGVTNESFRRYDLSYADSEAYEKLNHSFLSQVKVFKGFKSRFAAWKADFDGFVKAGKMPDFQMVRFPNDHTSGTRVGAPSPEAMVADNDYAVGQLVEAVSRSKFWRNTVICVLEDDAQAGIDHVDAHRSTAYVISPYVKRGILDSRFYNTDSMLRTMEIILGMPPMSQFDAVASPISVFDNTPLNTEPFEAILPNPEVFKVVNSKTAYRARESEMISRFAEESEVDEKLNAILWGAIKGRNAPLPALKNGLRTGEEEED
ncbi:MAG: hypothetical protein K8R88_14930 [Armatimonadetes bacterium]|nr:hypothetical protein [Armatimonadota bacterium]